MQSVESGHALHGQLVRTGSNYVRQQVAFNADGAPSKALVGFCAKNGADPAAVETRSDAKGVEYVWATRREPGRPAAEARPVHCSRRTSRQTGCR